MKRETNGYRTSSHTLLTDHLGKQAPRTLLDVSYKTALQAIPKAKQPDLREAQRTWLKFSDQNCGFFHNAESGATEGEARAYCIMRMTAERKAELDDRRATSGRGLAEKCDYLCRTIYLDTRRFWFLAKLAERIGVILSLH